MSSYDDLSSYSVKLQDQTFHASASSKPQDHLSLMKKLEAIRSGGAGAERMADFCRTLLTKKISVFSANDDATVNSMERVLGNPWLMTNTEFAWSWEYETDVPCSSVPRGPASPDIRSIH